jgi:phage FluMu protein Com
MDPLHATLEELAADRYTHVSCHCPRCRMTRIRPMSWLPKISMGLTLDQLSRRLRCAECGGPLQIVAHA